MITTMHGGPDDGPAIEWDFSSNANAVPLPDALYSKLTSADRRRYPDPQYTALRAQLAKGQGTEPGRILPTAGGSEGIRRLTLAAYLRGVRQVWVPSPAYGDYEAAALALGMAVSSCEDPMQAHGPALLWLCEPCNPTGQRRPAAFWSSLAAHAHMHTDLIVAIDRAYEPLRLLDADPIGSELADACWQLWSPNKALGLTGVRAGWMQAPLPMHEGIGALHALLQALSPSWVVSAEGVQLLMHWHDDDVQSWLHAAKRDLQAWMPAMQRDLMARGWACQPSVAPFFLAQPHLDHGSTVQDLLMFLRTQGIKLRDAESLGLPGQVRLRVHAPEAQSALLEALHKASSALVNSSVSARRAA